LSIDEPELEGISFGEVDAGVVNMEDEEDDMLHTFIFSFKKNSKTYPRICTFSKCRISVSVSARYGYPCPYPCNLDDQA
jgi:hypothetical protein